MGNFNIINLSTELADKLTLTAEHGSRLYDYIQNNSSSLIQSQFQNIGKIDDSLLAAIESKHQKDDEKHSATLEMRDMIADINGNQKAQLDSINRTLDFIVNSLGANSQILEHNQSITIAKLEELTALIEKKDSKGFKTFVDKHGIESLSLILQLLMSWLTSGK